MRYTPQSNIELTPEKEIFDLKPDGAAFVADLSGAGRSKSPSAMRVMQRGEQWQLSARFQKYGLVFRRYHSLTLVATTEII